MLILLDFGKNKAIDYNKVYDFSLIACEEENFYDLICNYIGIKNYILSDIVLTKITKNEFLFVLNEISMQEKNKGNLFIPSQCIHEKRSYNFWNRLVYYKENEGKNKEVLKLIEQIINDDKISDYMRVTNKSLLEYLDGIYSDVEIYIMIKKIYDTCGIITDRHIEEYKNGIIN